MNITLTNRIARIVALPIAAAGIAGGIALGLSGTAAAADSQSSYVAVPHTVAQPPVTATPGSWWRKHHPSLLDPTTAAYLTTPGA